MDGKGGRRRGWMFRVVAGAALLGGMSIGTARAQMATNPGNSSANPGTTPPQATPADRSKADTRSPAAAATGTPAASPSPGQDPHPVDTSGPVVRSIFDQSDTLDDHPVGAPADVGSSSTGSDPAGSSFDRQDMVNDHPVP